VVLASWLLSLQQCFVVRVEVVRKGDKKGGEDREVTIQLLPPADLPGAKLLKSLTNGC